MAELYALRLAAVFSTDAQLDVGPRLPAVVARDFHEPADARLVDGRERVRLEYFQFQVLRKEAPGVVPAHAERRLGEVVGAEAEELGLPRDLAREERGARYLDHGSDQVVEFCLLFPGDLRGDFAHDFDLQFQFFREADERDHDFRLYFYPLFLNFGRGFKNGAGLHLGNLGITDAEPAAPVAEHGVEFVQFLDRKSTRLNSS